MTKRVKLSSDTPKKKEIRPALTPDARENQLIYLATELAEQQLRDGTASSQVITHYLKLGSSKEKIEKEILEKQKDLITAKTEALQSAKHVEELYANAIEAMKSYSGHIGGQIDDENREY
jgi:chorismate synthase